MYDDPMIPAKKSDATMKHMEYGILKMKGAKWVKWLKMGTIVKCLNIED